MSANGLVGDFGKDPRVAPVLLSARADDPDWGDTIFGNGDMITLTFDRCREPDGTRRAVASALE